MSILNDREIKALCTKVDDANFKPMIEPFFDHQVRVNNDSKKERKVLSYGLDSFGYDVRLDTDIKLFTNINSSIVDPKEFNEECLIQGDIKLDENGSQYILIPPNSYMLGKTIETFNIPKDMTVILLGKSTYARSGIIINSTIFKPGFNGSIVVEISNSSSLPVKIYVNEGIASCLFFRGNEPINQYMGIYQNQTGVKLPTV